MSALAQTPELAPSAEWQSFGASACSLYRRQEWFRFRETCIQSAERKCERCGISQVEASLQVHHPHYQNGLMPWEYDVKFCEVLCKGCHAKEHGKIKPLDGWTLMHSDWDDGEPTGPTHCEHCDTPMEWHNDLWHPDWGVITVGYDCAEKLGNPDVHKIKRNRDRMNTFVFSPRWRRTSKGWKYRHGGRDVFALENDGAWKLNISGTWGRIRYGNLYEAKVRAFQFISANSTDIPNPD